MATPVKINLSPELPAGRVLEKSRVLLHCCCAPCSTAIIEWMAGQGLRPGVFFSNSNIVPKKEYEHRLEELKRYAASFGMEVIDDDYDHAAWLDAENIACGGFPLKDFPERGLRCLSCFKFRLDRAAEYAATHGYDILTTSLASSRWKDLRQVGEAGEAACAAANASHDTSLAWWNQNWRKGGLQDRRNAIIKERNIYNQDYCGCEFSPKEGKASTVEAMAKEHEITKREGMTSKTFATEVVASQCPDMSSESKEAMSMEIERKFLVRGDYKKDVFKTDRIVQGYIATVRGTTVRVRIRDGKGYITLKGLSDEAGLSRFEWEREIPVEEAESLLSLCDPGVIDKVRSLVKVGGHIFEVDEFHGDNEGLTVAEVELSSESEPFEKPAWLGEEVTGDRRYYNSHLLENPYKNWK